MTMKGRCLAEPFIVGRRLKLPPGNAALKIRLLVERLFMRLAHHRRFDGLWLGVLGDKSDDPQLCRVEAALTLIKRHDPVRYKRILRDIERIWICPLPGFHGGFNAAFNRCDLDFEFVKSASPEVIASTIVHEAIHARPCMRKIGYAEPLRYRIEQICMLQQLAFTARLPGGDEARDQVERNLTRPSAFWSDQSLNDWRREGALVAFRQLGVPDWLT